ncbi:PH domain-containing protein [Streptomyces tropicalis]|uniref:PH domain-containing protein n=1 Tax=Streptomyces tropicalis TaxID=3034234 RepID=A0ABT6A0Q4_9ACTN|nr:PH domain-containing protein [Streptomyces tropicalis]MDF3298226.1 PH domain-containing protein [Streptomyces tropicalis]
MTTPEPESPAPQPTAPESSDRVYRSSAGIAGGVLLLAIVAWLGLDALFTGHGRTPWLALAAMILAVPLVVAFTLRPAVHAGPDRLRVRNPFRVVVLPWGQIAVLRSGYTNEAVSKAGTKYQLWALPVSLGARKRAARRTARATAAPRTGAPAGAAAARTGPERAQADQAMDDLRELHETRENAATAQGGVTVRWAYEIVGPALAGAVVLAILLIIG